MDNNRKSSPRDDRGRFVKKEEHMQTKVIADEGVRDFNRIVEHGEPNEQKQHKRDMLIDFLQNIMGIVVTVSIIWLILCAFCACTPQKKTIYLPVVKTVTVETTVHDTIVETELVEYYTERETRDSSSYLSNRYAYSNASVIDGVLNHSLGIHPDATTITKIPIEDRIITITDSIPYPVPYPVEVKGKLTFLQQLLMYIGGISLLLITLLVMVKWLQYR